MLRDLGQLAGKERVTDLEKGQGLTVQMLERVSTSYFGWINCYANRQRMFNTDDGCGQASVWFTGCWTPVSSGDRGSCSAPTWSEQVEGRTEFQGGCPAPEGSHRAQHTVQADVSLRLGQL